MHASTMRLKRSVNYRRNVSGNSSPPPALAIIVLLAISQFNSKMTLSDLPEEIQRDARTLFGSMKNAMAEARDALLSVADLSLRNETAVAAGLTINSQDDHLMIDPDAISSLPLPLRLYVELGGLFLGSPEEAGRIKIHLRSNKLTFFYDPEKMGLSVYTGPNRTPIPVESGQ